MEHKTASETSSIHNLDTVVKCNTSGPGYKRLFCHAQRVLKGFSGGSVRRCLTGKAYVHPKCLERSRLRMSAILDDELVRRDLDMDCVSSRESDGVSSAGVIECTLQTTININETFIDKGTWRVTSVKYHKDYVVTGKLSGIFCLSEVELFFDHTLKGGTPNT